VFVIVVVSVINQSYMYMYCIATCFNWWKGEGDGGRGSRGMKGRRNPV